VLPAVGMIEFAACIPPPIRHVNLCGTSRKTSCTNTTAPASPTNWMPTAATTHPVDADLIAGPTPLRPGTSAMIATPTPIRTATRIPARISLCLIPE